MINKLKDKIELKKKGFVFKKTWKVDWDIWLVKQLKKLFGGKNV